MKRRLIFQPEAETQFRALAANPAKRGLYKQLLKTLGFLEANTRHPSLKTHRYFGLTGPNGATVWEAYVQNCTPGAYRIFFCYGPDTIENGNRQAVITLLKLTPHP